jgi:hypothetical protein
MDKIDRLESQIILVVLRIPASSTTKTGRHDIAEILLKVALAAIIKSNHPKG